MIGKKNPHDPLEEWKKLGGRNKVNIRNEGPFYSASAAIRLTRSKFGTWTLHVLPINSDFHLFYPDGVLPKVGDGVESLGVHVLIDSHVIDELKRVGVPMYIEELK
jgi:hypothetical protein